MSKYNRTARYTHAPSMVPAIKTDIMTSGTTHEGAPGYGRDTKSELFLLAVSLFAGEPSFYETKDERTERFKQLVRTVAVSDPDWTARFLRWLRADAYIRTASIVGAIEAADAMVKAKIPGSRTIVDSVLQRPDEPGEAIAYWRAVYGRRQLPKPIKRGIADAVSRLYTERAWLKWDSTKAGVRFADVIELVHPGADKYYQTALFPFILNSRHGRKQLDAEVMDRQLPMITTNRIIRERVAGGEYGLLLDTATLQAAGLTWEDSLSMAGTHVDKARLWEAMIPNMGYMALLRNLRKFDEAGISAQARNYVAHRLSDPAEVASSKQFPFRFLAAYQAVKSLNWGPTLETALELSLQNVPVLQGRSLVMIDRSGSMFNTLSANSDLMRCDQAAIFGSALKLRNIRGVDLVEFGTDYRTVNLSPGESLLRSLGKYHDLGGTYTARAVQANYKGHDRVIIVTDEQSADGNPGGVVPAHIPIYSWNVAGYAKTSMAGTKNRFTFAGMTDQAFGMIQLMEAGATQLWPF